MSSLTALDPEHTLDPERIGVVLIDDDAMALTCLESYFTAAEDIHVLLATRHADQMLEFLESNRVNVLITDVHMESMDGVEMAREVLRVSRTPAAAPSRRRFSTWVISLPLSWVS